MPEKKPEPGFVLNLMKRRSETPLQTIERYVAAHPELKGARMTYAGRLDPMAEGVLVVLGGDKNKERDAYTGLDKEYEFEFVLGFETDTFDLLGKVTSASLKSASLGDVEKALMKYVGKFQQKYPPYSSKVVNGEQMFALARAGKLKPEDIPSHEVEVKSIELLGEATMFPVTFSDLIRGWISKVTGDFRQKEILELWEDALDSLDLLNPPLAFFKAKVSCGSGFYVRQLVSDVGRDLGTGAVTVSIKRTRVGDFKIEDSVA